MTEYRSLCHTKWECKYHVVFIPKYRRKRIYGAEERRCPVVRDVVGVGSVLEKEKRIVGLLTSDGI